VRRPLRAAGGRALKTLTSAPTEDLTDLDAYSIDPADAFDVHSFRGGHVWDKRRHIASLTRSDNRAPRRLVGINSEPPGSGALVSSTEHPEELDDESVALLAVASLIARQAFVWFSGEGVKLDRGLATAAGFQSVPTAVRLLPRDVMRFQIRHHPASAGRPSASWRRRATRIDGHRRATAACAHDRWPTPARMT
jgi:hypothetical protein